MTRSDRWDTVTPIVDWILRVVGVLGLIVASFAVVDIRNQADCQAEVNTAQNIRSRNLDGDLTRERNASRRVDDALAAVLAASIQTLPANREQIRPLVTELLTALSAQSKARADADKARADNPPITEPTTTC